MKKTIILAALALPLMLNTSSAIGAEACTTTDLMSPLDQECMNLVGTIKGQFTQIRKTIGQDLKEGGALEAHFSDKDTTHALIKKYKNIFLDHENGGINVANVCEIGLNQQYKNIFWNGGTFSPEFLLLAAHLQNKYNNDTGLSFNPGAVLNESAVLIENSHFINQMSTFNYFDDNIEKNDEFWAASDTFLSLDGNPALFLYITGGGNMFYVTLDSVFNGMLTGMEFILTKAVNEARFTSEKDSVKAGLLAIIENLKTAKDYLENPSIPLDLCVAQASTIDLKFTQDVQNVFGLTAESKEFFEKAITLGFLDTMEKSEIASQIKSIKQSNIFKEYVSEGQYANVFFASNTKILAALKTIAPQKQ